MKPRQGIEGGGPPGPADPPPPHRPERRWQFGLAQLLGLLTLAAFVVWLYSDWLRRAPLLTLAVIAVCLVVGLLPHLGARLLDRLVDRHDQRRK